MIDFDFSPFFKRYEAISSMADQVFEKVRGEHPDEVRFPALRLAREVMEAGGLSGAIFNAAKEKALDAFIAGQIGFMDMAHVAEDVLTEMSSDAHHIDAAISLDNVTQADHLARMCAQTVIKKLRQKA